MTALTLKSYQQSALDALATYARAARVKGPAAAFAEHAGRAYNADAFGPDVPCVCLRIPTGGGKTVLAAHAVALYSRLLCELSRLCLPFADFLARGCVVYSCRLLC